MKIGTDAMVLGALCQFPQQSNLLDIGAGTGVLSLIAAQRFNPKQVIAVELHSGACSDARTNFEHAPFNSGLEVVEGDITVYHPVQLFDGIISNPPFFDNSSKSNSDERALARHTDTLSDGDLLDAVKRLLHPNGIFWVILPFDKTKQFIQIAAEKGLNSAKRMTIYGKPGSPVRSVLAFTFQKAESGVTELTIRNMDGSYTREYIQLTKELHGTDLG